MPPAAPAFAGATGIEGQGTPPRARLLRRDQPCRIHARHHQGDLAPRPRQPRPARRRRSQRGQPHHLPPAARRNRRGWRDQAARAARHHRRGQRRRHQRHLPGAGGRDRPEPRSAHGPVARRGRRRHVARPARQAEFAHVEDVGDADRLVRRRPRSDPRHRPQRCREPRGSRQDLALHPLALVRTTVRRTHLRHDAARRFRRDGERAARAPPAAAGPAARPVRDRHRFPRPSRTAAAQFAARSGRDRAPARSALHRPRRPARQPCRSGRAYLRRARDLVLPRRLPALHRRRTRRRAGGPASALARPPRLPHPRPSASGCGRRRASRPC